MAPGEIERINPRDNEAYRFPVAVKGVVIRNGDVILLRNDRDEWELPGGKLELCESPEECLAREIAGGRWPSCRKASWIPGSIALPPVCTLSSSRTVVGRLPKRSRSERRA